MIRRTLECAALWCCGSVATACAGDLTALEPVELAIDVRRVRDWDDDPAWWERSGDDGYTPYTRRGALGAPVPFSPRPWFADHEPALRALDDGTVIACAGRELAIGAHGAWTVLPITDRPPPADFYGVDEQCGAVDATSARDVWFTRTVDRALCRYDGAAIRCAALEVALTDFRITGGGVIGYAAAGIGGNEDTRVLHVSTDGEVRSRSLGDARVARIEATADGALLVGDGVWRVDRGLAVRAIPLEAWWREGARVDAVPLDRAIGIAIGDADEAVVIAVAGEREEVIGSLTGWSGTLVRIDRRLAAAAGAEWWRPM